VRAVVEERRDRLRPWGRAGPFGGGWRAHRLNPDTAFGTVGFDGDGGRRKLSSSRDPNRINNHTRIRRRILIADSISLGRGWEGVYLLWHIRIRCTGGGRRRRGRGGAPGPAAVLRPEQSERSDARAFPCSRRSPRRCGRRAWARFVAGGRPGPGAPPHPHSLLDG
jgi:hypothetical protein